MSKGLEYIRDISCLISENYSDKEPLTEEQKLSKNCFLDYCKYIEKELKALEIIKKKRVNANQLLLCWKAEMYNSRCRKGYELSKEEYELLKRWLEKWN